MKPEIENTPEVVAGDGSSPSAGSAIRDQVILQCKAVSHMANTLAKVHAELAAILEHAKEDSPIVERLGICTTERMEMLGDLCNAMDIVEDRDAWIDPVMVEARRLWQNDQGESQTPAE